MTMNDKVHLFYNLIDQLDHEIDQATKRNQNNLSGNKTYLDDLKLRKKAALMAIGSIKSEVDKKFADFVSKVLNSKPNASDLEKLNKLLIIFKNTNDKERVVIIEDTICVNKSQAEETKSLLVSLKGTIKDEPSDALSGHDNSTLSKEDNKRKNVNPALVTDIGSYMEIKNVREPNKKEKKDLIPKLIIGGLATAAVTLIIYLTDFKAEIGDSMYIAEQLLPNKSIATHNAIIKLFETIYGRDYMLSKLEGLSISALVGIIFDAVVYSVYKFERIKGKI